MMRPPAKGEARAYERALTTAQQTGLAFIHPLDKVLFFASLWMEPEPLRAKLTEAYTHELGRVGLAFVPVARPFFPVETYRVAPLTDPRDGAPFPTVVIVLPAASIAAAVRRPPGESFAALLRVEAPRLRAEHERTGTPMPAALAELFAEDAADDDEEA